MLTTQKEGAKEDSEAFTTHLLRKLVDSGINKDSIWRAESPNNPSPRSNSSDKPASSTDSPLIFNTLPFDNLPFDNLKREVIHELIQSEDLKTLPHIIPTAIAAGLYKNTSQHLAMQKFTTHKFYTIWIGRNCWPTPFLLKQLFINTGIDPLSCSLFIDPPTYKLKLWAIETALRSGGAQAIIASCERASFSVLRRLSIAIRENGKDRANKTLCLLLRPVTAKELPSPAGTRWLIEPNPSKNENPSWKVSLLRSKGAQFFKNTKFKNTEPLKNALQNEWVMELNNGSLELVNQVADTIETINQRRVGYA